MKPVMTKMVFDNPTKLIFGKGSVQELPSQLMVLGASSIMLVCDHGLVKAGVAGKIADIIKTTEGIKFCMFDKIMANPSDIIMDEGFEFAKANKVNAIVGLGGGSSLDSAKGIALLMTNGGKLREYLMEGKEVSKKIAPTICIPTTAGTGSEVTRTVVATDHVTKFKDGFKNPDTIVASVAILDPELMLTLPAPVMAACAMDALTHAIESYITWKSNPITDSLNLHAIKLIGNNIRKAFTQFSNLDAKGHVLLASCMTGIAFDQSGLGIAHCMGHPLGGLFDLPHGVACAMALPKAMEYNLISCPEKMAEIAEALGEKIEGCSMLEAGEKAIDAVVSLLEDIELPTRLKQFNIGEESIPKLVEDAMAFRGMIDANPRDIDKNGMERLFRELL